MKKIENFSTTKQYDDYSYTVESMDNNISWVCAYSSAPRDIMEYRGDQYL